MEGEEGEKRPLVNSASEMEDEGKKLPCQDSASVTAAAAGRKALHCRSCDDRVKAYIDMRAQVKGGSSRKGRYEKYDAILVGGKLAARPSRYTKQPKIPGIPSKVKPGVFYPIGAPSYPAPGKKALKHPPVNSPSEMEDEGSQI
ncbi:hypothetical protein L1987_42369 [Smallanthus sonchifolius]|uniref:Uncharacterized protein n=2 Tax=Smallanthus sonchifolius TaxID=185202 RepID=A0ACB9GJM2_9ASTR|nr:hypothetical protein L1987_42363 [Smallanthus sonchifolius]KAI3783292.1 hypothetical protein L1987_42369 [Smallanthus sonchifolius]